MMRNRPDVRAATVRRKAFASTSGSASGKEQPGVNQRKGTALFLYRCNLCALIAPRAFFAVNFKNHISITEVKEASYDGSRATKFEGPSGNPVSSFH
ncbi:hypothetical protein NDU88_001214 [Pleurodeles waltl]|uniref:Uncharacterized protein n=1 Tax=Pleurodeles waltl TaxID=8319 RepID=A0AAV7MJW6_PLEWA|nr:hypothetical protein NDU88_001214 [Pleurodeles waltl]